MGNQKLNVVAIGSGAVALILASFGLWKLLEAFQKKSDLDAQLAFVRGSDREMLLGIAREVGMAPNWILPGAFFLIAICLAAFCVRSFKE